MEDLHDTAELTDLVGLHTLTAVSWDSRDTDWAFSPDASCLIFKLDEEVYTAIEDRFDDEYGSMLYSLAKGDANPKADFPPCQVFCYTEGAYEFSNNDDDILVMRDVITGKVVLKVGTDYHDGCAPKFASLWIPENMAVNQAKGEHHV